MLNHFRSRLTNHWRGVAHRLDDLLASADPTPRVPTVEDLRSAWGKLERLLLENILPFWYPRVLDAENGGFTLSHDLRGEYKGPTPKGLVAQARTTWFFARLARSPYAKPEHQEAAAHGIAFLRDRLWDPDHGGFFWEVDASGRTATRADKHLYGQAFGLFALSEFATSSRDSDALGLARELLRLLEERAHDRVHGGYIESHRADWSPAPKEAPNWLIARAGVKTLNTHLHLMEALIEYFRASGDRLAQERLVELILVQSNAVVRRDLGACTDAHTRDWRPLHGKNAMVSYGHDLENVCMLHDACEVLGLSQGPVADLYRTLFEYSTKFGWDRRRGGFFYTGGWNARANRRPKIWWVQAEALVAALVMYRFTGEPFYFDIFSRTLDWIEKRQADWEFGDWHAAIEEDGTPSGDKASAWKTPYHNGRAVLKCLELLAPLADVRLSISLEDPRQSPPVMT